MKIVRGVLVIEDGEKLVLIAKTEPNGFDPLPTFYGMTQIYRVVANVFGEVLELVPEGKPRKMSVAEFEDATKNEKAT